MPKPILRPEPKNAQDLRLPVAGLTCILHFMEHSPIGMLITDLDGVWGYTNIALQTLLGLSAVEMSALPAGGPCDPEEWSASAIGWQRLMSGEIADYGGERRFRHHDGHWVSTRVAVSLLRDEGGVPLHFIVQIESLEARRRVEECLAEERERLRVTLAAIEEAVITTDAQTRITSVNAAAETMLGHTLQEIEGRPVNEIIHLMDPRTCKASPNLIAQCLLHGTMFRRLEPCILHRPNGDFTFIADVVSPVLNSTGNVNGMVIVLRDVSNDVRHVQEMQYRATHDEMTALANGLEFQRRLKEIHAQAIHLEHPAALLAIDLDRFKAVNDTGGHAAGDAVLRRAADLLRSSVRQSDVVARLGGDEFAIILPNCPEARTMVVAAKILQALNPLQVECGSCTYTVGASVGVAMLDPLFKAEADWLTAADRACRQAKMDGSSQVRLAS